MIYVIVAAIWLVASLVYFSRGNGMFSTKDCGGADEDAWAAAERAARLAEDEFDCSLVCSQVQVMRAGGAAVGWLVDVEGAPADLHEDIGALMREALFKDGFAASFRLHQ